MRYLEWSKAEFEALNTEALYKVMKQLKKKRAEITEILKLADSVWHHKIFREHELEDKVLQGKP